MKNRSKPASVFKKKYKIKQKFKSKVSSTFGDKNDCFTRLDNFQFGNVYWIKNKHYSPDFKKLIPPDKWNEYHPGIIIKHSQFKGKIDAAPGTSKPQNEKLQKVFKIKPWEDLLSQNRRLEKKETYFLLWFIFPIKYKKKFKKDSAHYIGSLNKLKENELREKLKK